MSNKNDILPLISLGMRYLAICETSGENQVKKKHNELVLTTFTVVHNCFSFMNLLSPLPPPFCLLSPPPPPPPLVLRTVFLLFTFSFPAPGLVLQIACSYNLIFFKMTRSTMCLVFITVRLFLY